MKEESLVLIAIALSASSQAMANPAQCLRKADRHLICMNDVVMSTTNTSNIGTVISMYGNGLTQVSMSQGYYRQARRRSIQIENLSRATNCVGSICTNTSVMSRSNNANQGTVSNVFEMGQAVVNMSGTATTPARRRPTLRV